MSSRANGGALRTIALFLVVVIMAGIIAGTVFLGFKTAWYTDWSIFRKNDDEEKEPKGEESTVTDGEGNALMSGVSYAMPAALVYSAPTAQSVDAGEGVTVTATVTPSTAINKNVTWGAAFADPQSAWATGKSISDYFTATPGTDNPNEVTLECLAPFGEQIILTATSEYDETASASCTVDYRQKLESVSVNIGNVPVNLKTDTNVTINIASSSTDIGGEVTLDYTLSDTYTIAAEVSETSVALTRQGSTGAFFSYVESQGAGRANGIDYDDIPDALGKSIYFDLRLFSDYNFTRYYQSMGGTDGAMTTTNNYFKDMTTEELAQTYQTRVYGQASNGNVVFSRNYAKLWNVKVTIKMKGLLYEESSPLIWKACSGANVNVDPGNVEF